MIKNPKYKQPLRLVNRLLFSNRCRVCGKVTAVNLDICENCSVEKFRISENAIAAKSTSNKNYDRITSPFYYTGNIKTCIQNFKYKGFKRAADFLSAEMIKVLERDFADEEVDYITCVPVTRRRRRQRGYNQDELLLKEIAKAFNLKSAPKLLIKTKNTPTQVNLKMNERKSNLKGAFRANDKFHLENKTILLCDDVKTTGSTLDECSKTLKKAGAKRVICVTCALNEF